MTNPELELWLRERGVEGARRVVAADERAIVLSKTPEGFVPRLMSTLERVEAALSPDALREAYRRTARPGEPRVDAWERACQRAVSEAVQGQQLPPDVVDEVMYGVESVGALLRAVLWPDHRVGDGSLPTPAEQAAFEDAWAALERGSLFTRVYGTFDGRPVVAHCPGARIARELFRAGWEICASDGQAFAQDTGGTQSDSHPHPFPS